MDKKSFLKELQHNLSSLPKSEVEKTLNFYSELIDDKMEDGMSEADALASMSAPKAIADTLVSKTAMCSILKQGIEAGHEKIKASGNQGLAITLIILGFPLWLPLLLTVFALVLTFYAVIVAFLGALAIIVLACFFCGIGTCLGGVFAGELSLILCQISLGIGAVGLSLLLVAPTSFLAKKLVQFTVYFVRKVKLFVVKSMPRKSVDGI